MSEASLIVSGLTALTLVMTYPVVRTATTALPNDPGDPVLNTWILAWDAERLLHGLRGLWDIPSFFPYPHTLVYTEHLLGIAVLVAPINWVTRNPVVAYNVAFLLSFVVAGAAMYGLVRSLTGRPGAAWIAALIFTFCPYRMSMLSHLQVLWSGWLVLALWAQHRYFETQSRAAVLAFAGSLAMQALSNGYFLYVSLVAIVVAAAFEAWHSRPPLATLVRDATIAITVVAVILAPIVLAYARARRDQGLVRSYEEIVSYGADVGAYLRASDSSLLWRWLPGPARLEGDLFPGVAAIVLTGFLWRARPRPLAVLAFATIGVLGFILSLGPTPTLWGRHLLSHGPYEWLMWWVPGFDGLRVPARFSVLVFLSLAVLAGFGAARLLEAMGTRRRAQIITAVSVAILAEGHVERIPTVTIPAMTTADRGAYVWLRGSSPGGVVELPIQRPLSHSRLVYPTRDPAGYLNATYQFRTLFHHHPIVNGQSGYEPLLNVQLRRLIEEPDLDEALTMLRSVGVRYLIVHSPSTSSQPIRAITADDIEAQRTQVLDRIDWGPTVGFRLRPWPEEENAAGRSSHLSRIAAENFQATASEATNRLVDALDGDPTTRWSTDHPQQGQEWIEIDFDRRRRIARVEMDLGSDFSEYPRRLAIDGYDANSPSARLFDNRVVPILARTLVQRVTLPALNPVMIVVAPTWVSRLRIRQTGHSRLWRWSIHELALWEQP